MNREENRPIRYEDLWNTVPDGLPRAGRKYRKLHIWQVLLFFIVSMLLFVKIGSLAQYYFGLGGVILTQIGFLILSLLMILVSGANYREVLPLHRPKIFGLIGVFVAWIGVFFGSEAISFLLFVIAPRELLEISQSISNTLFGTGFGATLAILLVSIAPAICEEVMHRGVILSGFRTDLRGHKWVAIFCSGAIFGIFHLYPVRMLPTAFIGFVMAYLTLTTNNMVYSAFLHFVHNGLLMLLQAITSGAASSETIEQSTQLIVNMRPGIFGIYIAFFGAPAPILLYLGCWMVRRATAPVKPTFLPRGEEKKTLFLILGSTLAVVFAGALIFLVCR